MFLKKYKDDWYITGAISALFLLVLLVSAFLGYAGYKAGREFAGDNKRIIEIRCKN